MMNFEVVFDLAESGYRTWWFPGLGLVLVIIGIVLVKFKAVVHGWKMPVILGKIFPYLFLGFSIFWMLGTLTLTFGEYYFLKKAYDEGRYRVIEGPVTEFVPMPYSGHKRESFNVARKKFSYSNFAITSAFNNTQSHGGPISEGLYVRVTHIGDAIVKLEIRR